MSDPTRIRHALLIAALLAGAACGDDDKTAEDRSNVGAGSGEDASSGGDASSGTKDGGSDADASVNGGDAGEGLTKPRSTECKGTFAKLSLGELYDSSRPKGQCRQADDIEELCTDDPAETAKDHGTSCYLASPEDDEKIIECIVDAVKSAHPDVANGCVGCFAESVNCTAQHCRGQCAFAPDSMECEQCRVEQGCREDFFTCTGLVDVDML